MIKIGLIGEDPHDTDSIRNILLKRYRSVRFIQIARGVRGNQLDTEKLFNVAKLEYSNGNFNFLIFIRDLDAFYSEKIKLKKKMKWFNNLNAQTGKENIFLLNVWELEALIFADIQTLNKFFKITTKFSGDPSMIKDPKEELKRITGKCKNKYYESDCPKIFSKLSIEEVERKCLYFRRFLEDFDQKVKT